MAYETVEMIVADRERLRAEVERLRANQCEDQCQHVADSECEVEQLRAEVERIKRERAAREADSLAALTEWAEKYRDARRAAMEEVRAEYARGVGDGARLLPKAIAHVRATYPNWPEADWTSEAVDAMQPGSNSSEAFFVVKLLDEAAAIRAAAKEER